MSTKTKDRNGNILDPDSPLYKRDPYTLEYYMAKRTDQKFFSQIEHDLYHNTIKKNKKIAEKVKEEEANSVSAKEERNSKCAFAITQLETMNITTEEREFRTADILALGIDLHAYDGIYRIQGAPNNFYITFGPFEIAIWGSDTLLILKTKTT